MVVVSRGRTCWQFTETECEASKIQIQKYFESLVARSFGPVRALAPARVVFEGGLGFFRPVDPKALTPPLPRRKAAIEGLERHLRAHGLDGGYRETVRAICDKLKDLGDPGAHTPPPSPPPPHSPAIDSPPSHARPWSFYPPPPFLD